MKFLHIADLHIGKKLAGRNLAEDQEYILNQILSIINEQKIDALLIAGDVYDRTIPPEDAVHIFDEFLTAVSKEKIPVFIIDGNHDSAERLSFGNRILKEQNIHITDRYAGTVPSVTVEDEFGPIHIHLLPFIRQSAVRNFYPDTEIETLDDALRIVINNIPLNTRERNILVAHQFVVNGADMPEVADEVNTVGDIDGVSSRYFSEFDYVALGHLHGAQEIGSSSVQYAGSPLKYSLAEKDQKKSVTVVIFGKKGTVSFERIPLIPLRDLREIRGPLAKLISREVVQSANAEDYVHPVITDSVIDKDLQQKIAAVYPNYVSISLERDEREISSDILSRDDLEKLDPESIFAEFFHKQTGNELTKRQEEIVRETFEEVRAA